MDLSGISSGELETFLRTTPDLLCVAGFDGYFRQVNAAFSRLLGWTEEELLARSSLELVHPDDLEATLAELERLRRGRTSGPFENRYLRKDGGYVWLSWTSRPIGEDRCVAVARDVTERVEAQRATRQALAQAEAGLAERDARIAELEEARRRAEEEARLKGEFLARMSHEIRTPMNGVMGMAELLLDTRLSNHQWEYAHAIYTSGEALLNVINEILDLSKLEAGRMELEHARFTPAQVVHDVVELFAPRAVAKGLDIACRVAPQVPAELSGDPYRLRQVLSNLVSNAVKFTERGEVLVHVALAERRGGRVRLRFEVSDTGVGMDEPACVSLFAPFAQAAAVSRREGTGLGLAISRQLVEMMDGTIDVESAPGVGTTFRFTVVLDDDAGVPAPEPAEWASLEGVHLLLVEPSEGVRGILEEELAEHGASVEPVADSTEALRRVVRALGEGCPYAVVIATQNLEGIDGLQLFRAIRAVTPGQTPAFVLLTGIDQQEVHEEARREGVPVCLTKPVRAARLLGAVASLVAGSEAREAPEPAPAEEVGSEPPGAASRGRVLLVEDDPTNQVLAATIVRKLGFTVDVAGDGRSALEAVRRRAYVLVLMDCHMPEMDGFQATAAIRALGGSLEDLPIVAMTANALPGDRDRCLAAGMDDYLAKPFTRDGLVAVLARWTEYPSDAGADAERAGAQGEGAGAGKALAATLEENLEALRGELDAEMVESLAAGFAASLGDQLRHLREALDDEDAAAVEHVAHAMKAPCEIFGAVRLAALFGELEATARAGDLARAPGLLGSIVSESRRVRALLAATRG